MPAIVIILSVVLAAAVCAAAGAAIGFNSLVRRRNRTSEAWSRIDEELRRRHSLIPKLVQTVRGHATHESAAFEAVTESRTRAIRAGGTEDPALVAAAENAVTSSLRSLFTVAEDYPVLCAQQGFLALQEELTAAEGKLAYARRRYNTSAQGYNAATRSFPRALIARRFRFQPVAFFQTNPGGKDVAAAGFTAAARPSAG